MKGRMTMAALFPLLAVLTIATYAGGLGVIFMVLNDKFEEWGVVVLGMALVVGVPIAAALLQRQAEKQ